MHVNVQKIGSAKTDLARIEMGFEKGLWKDKFAFLEADKRPIPETPILTSKTGPKSL